MIAIRQDQEDKFVNYDLSEEMFINKHQPVTQHQLMHLKELYRLYNTSSRVCWTGDIDLTPLLNKHFSEHAEDAYFTYDHLTLDDFFGRLCEYDDEYHLIGYICFPLAETTKSKIYTRYHTVSKNKFFKLIRRIKATVNV